MKKMTLLAASIALVLSGCGSSSDDNNTTNTPPNDNSTPGITPPDDNKDIPLIPLEPATPVTFTIKAIDGYLAYAKVYAVDAADCVTGVVNTDATLVGTTDADGALVLQGDALKYKEMALCVVAEKGVTIDSSRGVVTEDFVLSAVAGSEVISPLTTLVAARIADAADDGVVLSQADAEEEVLALFSDLEGVDGDLLFGDFIAAQMGESTKLAQAVQKMAEALVDTNDVHNVEDYTLRTLADVVNDAANNENISWTAYAPYIDSADGNAKDNQRPYFIGTDEDKADLLKLEVVQGTNAALVTSLAQSSFTDNDGNIDSLDFYVLDNGLNVDDFDDSEFASAFNNAYVGEYHIHAIATDDASVPAKSAPVPMMVTVTSDAKAPKFVSVADINAELVEFNLSEGSTIASGTTVSLDGVFADEDTEFDAAEMTYTIIDADGVDATTSIPGVTITEASGVLTFTGTPLVGGEFKVIVTATDGVYAPVQAEITIPVEATSDVSALAGLLEGSVPTSDVIYSSVLNEAVADGASSEIAYVDGQFYKDGTASVESQYTIDGNVITYNKNGSVTSEYAAYASSEQALVLNADKTAFNLITKADLWDSTGTPAAATVAWAEDAIVHGDTWYLVEFDGTPVTEEVDMVVTSYKFDIADNETKTVLVNDTAPAVAWSITTDTLTISTNTPKEIDLFVNDGKVASVKTNGTGNPLSLLVKGDKDLAERLADIADITTTTTP